MALGGREGRGFYTLVLPLLAAIDPNESTEGVRALEAGGNTGWFEDFEVVDERRRPQLLEMVGTMERTTRRWSSYRSLAWQERSA
jgi:hypothetical protein